MRTKPLRTQKGNSMSWFVFAVLMLASSQAEERLATTGRVIGSDGEPWIGAEVTLVSRPIPWCDRVGEVDDVRTTTGKRGLFRVQLLTGRPYSVWARCRGSDDKWRVTRLVEGAIAGRPLRLVETQTEMVRVRVRVTGQERWKVFAPLTYRLVPFASNLCFRPVALDESGEAWLPMVPPGDYGFCAFEVVANDGSVIYAHRIYTSKVFRARLFDYRREQAKKQGAPEPEGGLELERIALPRSAEIPVAVEDARTGKAIAGAEVRFRVSDYVFAGPPQEEAVRRSWARFGTTGKDGTCTLRILWAGDPFDPAAEASLYFEASAPGYANGHAGWTNGREFVAEKRPDEKSKVLRFRLSPAEPMHGRILVRPGTPAVGLTVVARAEYRVKMTGTATWRTFRSPLLYAQTDAEGRFSFNRMPITTWGIGHLVFVPPQLRTQLASDPMLTLPPTLELLRLGARRPSSLGVADLSKAGVVRLLVKKGGHTAHGVRIQSAAHARRGNLAFAQVVYTDRRGEATVCLQPGVSTLVVWDADQGYALRDVTVPRAEEGMLSISLKPLSVFAGRVVDGVGVPVADASLGVSGGGGDSEPFDPLVRRVNRALLRGTSDAQGRFALRFLPVPGRSTIVRVRGGAASASVRVDTETRDVLIKIQ